MKGGEIVIKTLSRDWDGRIAWIGRTAIPHEGDWARFRGLLSDDVIAEAEELSRESGEVVLHVLRDPHRRQEETRNGN